MSCVPVCVIRQYAVNIWCVAQISLTIGKRWREELIRPYTDETGAVYEFSVYHKENSGPSVDGRPGLFELPRVLCWSSVPYVAKIPDSKKMWMRADKKRFLTISSPFVLFLSEGNHLPKLSVTQTIEAKVQHKKWPEHIRPLQLN
jgi:hypothetical protein